MLPYYVDVLVKAFLAIPASLGSNMLGLVWPLIIVVVGEGIAVLVYGWRLVYREKLKKFSLVGFAALAACYTVLFVWCGLQINFNNFTTANMKEEFFRKAYEGSSAREQYAVLQAQSKCAETLGENRTLGQQNRDQQNTINNCQSEALKLLTPAAHKLTVLVWKEFDPKIENQDVEFLLLTNTTVTPFKMVITCPNRIDELSGGVVGGPSMGPEEQRLAPNSIYFEVDTPAWTPQTPIRVRLKYKSHQTSQCSFVER